MNVHSGSERERLRIAIQKNGRLAGPARSLLSACGLSWRQSRDKLFCYGETFPVDLLLVRDDDIPGLIADGVCDLGIVGRNELEEQLAKRQHEGLASAFLALRDLDFGQCRLMLAIPEQWTWTGIQHIAGMRIATSYPHLVAAWLLQHGLSAQIVSLSGSVEIAPRLGTADVICDLVSSGATLAANQLKPVETLLSSQAVLAGPCSLPTGVRAHFVALLLRRMDSILQPRDRKLLMFKASREQLPALCRLLPDADVIMQMPDDGSGVLQMQTMCRGALSWQRLEALEQAGANQLMVLAVECSFP